MKVRLDSDASAKVRGRRVQFARTHLAGAVVTIPTPPPKGATKNAWVDHAVDMGMPRGKAVGQTKDNLVERFG